MQDAAKQFQKKYGRPMVLILDGANYLASDVPEVVKELQYIAAQGAIDKTLRVIFVSEAGSLLPILMEDTKSYLWKRAKCIEIGEISDTEAISYLVKNGIEQEKAHKIVENITGGLIISLRSYVFERTCSHTTMTFEQILEQADNHLQCLLLSLGSGDKVKRNQMNSIFQNIVENGYIYTRHAREIMPIELLKKLLEQEILTIHSDDKYTFHNRHVAGWFRRNINKGMTHYLLRHNS